MLKVGLTGNIGSGKSTIAKIFEVLGIKVYYSDKESKKFLNDQDVISKVTSLFGNTVIDQDGIINKSSLAKIVFNDPSALHQLNNLLHPKVMEDFGIWCSKNSNEPYLINEAAIIFESGVSDHFDKIIYISCPEETAVKRVIERDQSTEMDVLVRMKFQWKDEKKATLSDYIIKNDGLELVIPQILRIHHQLLQSSP